MSSWLILALHSQVQRIDAQLDQLQFDDATSRPASSILRRASIDPGYFPPQDDNSLRVYELQSLIRRLSASPTKSLFLSPTRSRLKSALEKTVQTLHREEEKEERGIDHYELQLEWCAVGKAAAQTYGFVLGALLEEILPLSSDIWYWDEVLDSRTYIGLYTAQIAPLKFWIWSAGVYQDAQERFRQVVSGEDAQIYKSVTARWRQFYGLVRETMRDRSAMESQARFMSPVNEARLEARNKQKNLKKLRDLSASALGLLTDECFSFEMDELEVAVETGWQQNLSKSVILMDAVLQRLTSFPNLTVHDVEEQSFNHVDDYVDGQGPDWDQPPALANHLLEILCERIPTYETTIHRQTKENGKPSRILRYWMPATALLLSSGTILRIFFQRREAIITWIRELGSTVVDFWYNWILEPFRNLIGTIRHDKDSEIAIISKESLQGDRASLERMVVDFAVDNPGNESGQPLNEQGISEIRSKVREGDLTPVLKAYERDLRKPFVGAIRGELVRALLIQIQKTKVDVEVAIGGIDALLKSQELVFGLVGLTPSILICLAVSRYIMQMFSGRRERGQKHSRMNRVLRNIDRVLTLSRPNANHSIPYKDRGLLLCEIHILRQIGQAALPAGVRRDFLEDINDLVESRAGNSRQLKIVDRIRWAYGKYMQ